MSEYDMTNTHSILGHDKYTLQIQMRLWNDKYTWHDTIWQIHTTDYDMTIKYNTL